MNSRAFFSAWFLLCGVAQAADVGYRPEPAYGHDVKLSVNGDWLDDKAMDPGRRYAAADTDQRNGETAYQAAYDSFMEGRKTGGNRIEKMQAGRWVKKITTPDDYIILKDERSNVAVRGADGRWHLLNAKGQYRLSANSPEAWNTQKTAVAKAAKPEKKKRVVAKAAKPARASARNRSPASIVTPSEPAALDGSVAVEGLASAAPESPAQAPPAASAAAAAPAEAPATAPPPAPATDAAQLSAMDALRKLAESGSAAPPAPAPAAPAGSPAPPPAVPAGTGTASH